MNLYTGPDADYKYWCKDKGYKTEENIFDALYALLFWPLCFFMPNPENIRKKEYTMDVRNGRWKPYEIAL